MKIRIADEVDSGEIANIIKRHAQDDYMGYATFDDKYIRDKMKRDYFLIAEEGKLIGCARLSIVYIDLAEIRTMCVDHEYRGKGIAKALMNFALELLKNKSMRKIVARTKSGNTAALNFFGKFGFEQEGYFKEHYRKGIDIIQLAKFI